MNPEGSVLSGGWCSPHGSTVIFFHTFQNVDKFCVQKYFQVLLTKFTSKCSDLNRTSELFSVDLCFIYLLFGKYFLVYFEFEFFHF